MQYTNVCYRLILSSRICNASRNTFNLCSKLAKHLLCISSNVYFCIHSFSSCHFVAMLHRLGAACETMATGSKLKTETMMSNQCRTIWEEQGEKKKCHQCECSIIAETYSICRALDPMLLKHCKEFGQFEKSLTVWSVRGGRTMVFSMVFMTSFQSSFNTRFRTVFSHILANSDKLRKYKQKKKKNTSVNLS